MEDFAAVQSSVSSALIATTRAASQVGAEDVTFHRSLDPSLGPLLDRQNARLLGLATRLLGTSSADAGPVRPLSLKDVDDLDGNWRTVVDVVDSLLERADTALDEFAGAVKRLSPGAAEQVVNAPSTSRFGKAGMARAQNIEKPQLLFDYGPNNTDTAPFKPLLLSKPHARVPLQIAPSSLSDGAQSNYAHPYQSEIEHYRYPTSIYSQRDPIPYKPFDSTTATFVDSEDLMEEMLQELKQAEEIAIDLEHHDLRSYIGIVSLMQISTREKDWVVDTLKPWRRKLQCLNEVFADPGIIKVLHGAFMDAVWLQRDLGLYLVGLFDTYHAARALGYPGASLAYLLKKFVNVDAQKQYQTADWRVRPLSPELFDYARSDTHYLLYIFDCMRNELIQRSDFALPNQEGDKLLDVLHRSRDVALQRYETPVYDTEFGQGPSGWYRMLSRYNSLLNKEQFAVFRAVHRWRDTVAREQDDSTNWVMPNHQIFSIAQKVPTSRPELLGIAQPITQTVRLRADELLDAITKARQSSTDGPDMIEILDRFEPNRLRGLAPASGPDGSVSAFLPKPPAPTATPIATGSGGIASILPLRSLVSTFWGKAFDSTAHQKRPLSLASDVSLSIPLPPLTAEVFADGTSADSPARHPPPQPQQAPSPEPQQPDEDVFILKQLGQKRKRADDAQADDGMAAQNDEVTLHDDEQERATQKAERKKARKAEKRAKKKAAAAAADGSGLQSSASAGAEDDDDDAAEEEPFDYASAPSILNQPLETREQMRARKKKEVNPYAKALLDAQKGLPRAQRERAGKSFTFKQ